MTISFNTAVRKRAVAAVGILLAVAYIGFAASQFLATWMGSKTEFAYLKRATWLDRGNADYQDHLGRYYDLVLRDPASAVGYYKRAVELNPHSARYWFDLAGSYQILLAD